MSFRFNFTGEDVINEPAEKKEEINWQESEEILPKKQITDFDKMVMHAKIMTWDDFEIGHIVISEAISNMNSENASILAKKENSDLVPGIYEGGLKIWECTNDMVEYLLENMVQMKDKKVLDLGCGAGILGIYAFLKGAEVIFQDYNKEVLEYVTIPNVLLNIENEDEREEQLKTCRFFSGDWKSFNEKLSDTDSFDIILTSETIYNENNYDKLIDLFLKRLGANGTIYVAAKTCYFGVGGGIRQFETSIQNNKTFDCEVCWKNTEGIQREILKITKK